MKELPILVDKVWSLRRKKGKNEKEDGNDDGFVEKMVIEFGWVLWGWIFCGGVRDCRCCHWRRERIQIWEWESV